MSKNQGFTLLELLITTSVTSLLMLAISSLFITFLGSAYKTRLSQSLRESGTHAMNQMIEMLRNANEISSTCQDNLTEINIINSDGRSTLFKEDNDRIASISGEQTFYLTDSPSNNDYVRNLLFSCTPTDSGKKYLSVSFMLQTSNESIESNNAKNAFLEFHSGVVTRN